MELGRQGKWLVLGGGGTVLALVVVLSLAGAGGSSSSGDPVDVQLAGRRPLTTRVKATGQIAPEKKVDISAKVVGEIVELPVQEGDPVKEGQVLLRIEPELYEAQRDQASAALRQAETAIKRLEIQLRSEERNLERLQDLRSGGYASQEKLEEAQLAASSAKVDLESQRHSVSQYRSALKRATDDLQRTSIRSPMDGVVIALNSEKGETVVPGSNNLPGSVIMTVADMSQLVAHVEVSEVDVVELSVGQPAEVFVDALGTEPQTGRVAEIGASGRKDPGSGAIRFEVKVALEDPHAGLRPAMTAKVNILTSDREAVLTVPIQAVVKRRLDADGKERKERKAPGKGDEDLPEQEVVYLLRNGRAQATPVRTGKSNELDVEIVSGLEEGDPVIIGPYRTLKGMRDGDRVQREEGTDPGRKSGAGA